MKDALVYALLAAGIPWLFKRFAPVKRTLGVFTREERARYEGWKMPVVLAYFMFTVICATAAFAGLRFLFAVLARPRIGSLVLLEPVHELWWLIALFLGLLAADLPTSKWLRHRVGPEGEKFEQYLDQREGLDSGRLRVVLACLFVPAALVGLVFGVTKADQLTTQGIVVGEAFVANPPLRPYHTVRTITHGTYASSRTREQDWFVVTFDDGTRWSNRNILWDGGDSTLVRTVLGLVSARSGRQIEER